MATLSPEIQQQVHKALNGMGPIFNACYKCASQVSVRAEEAKLDEKSDIVVGYFFSILCERCNETGPESMNLDEAMSLWCAKHKLITGGHRGNPKKGR